MLKAIIFDVDGTLVDSVDVHAQAWQDAFRAFGHDIPFDKLRSQIGKGGDQLLPVFLPKEEVEKQVFSTLWMRLQQQNVRLRIT